ncbi:hypothetical protein NL676_000209 [Syzygium grande]|nr:hypothetical protein NL676_000209 [Syzygium grande]
MAKMIVASSSSCKTHIPPTLSASKPKQQPQVTLSVPKFRLPSPCLPLHEILAPPRHHRVLRPRPPVAGAGGEIEKAALFDFNPTLPVIMGKFLATMFALDKIYFSSICP